MFTGGWQTSSAWFTKEKSSRSAELTAIYDGVYGSWEAFLQKFTKHADRAGWTTTQRRNNLCLCLRGQAAEFFKSLIYYDPDIDYFHILSELGQRFGQNKSSHTSTHNVQGYRCEYFSYARDNGNSSLVASHRGHLYSPHNSHSYRPHSVAAMETSHKTKLSPHIISRGSGPQIPNSPGAQGKGIGNLEERVDKLENDMSRVQSSIDKSIEKLEDTLSELVAKCEHSPPKLVANRLHRPPKVVRSCPNIPSKSTNSYPNWEGLEIAADLQPNQEKAKGPLQSQIYQLHPNLKVQLMGTMRAVSLKWREMGLFHHYLTLKTLDPKRTKD